ncbi:hypothetical protein BV898_08583 [Hypsibius exemplaris]|uniref:Arylsulfatase J n=1 Tax=Hypsibius exemplaris TaxID=2072580 RepID=A0A1W0WQ60_HYPEX|nr:hypothetical protein BV898_08583 [Hypsibius exemplaris]
MNPCLSAAGLTVGPRKETVNNVDSILNQYAMTYVDSYGGMYKPIGGNVFENSFLGWFVPKIVTISMTELITRHTLSGIGRKVPLTEGTFAGDNTWRVYTPAEINCNFPEGVEVNVCESYKANCMFDLLNDPCELNNIASSYPAMLKLLQDKIEAYNATSVHALIQPQDPAGLAQACFDDKEAPSSRLITLGQR